MLDGELQTENFYAYHPIKYQHILTLITYIYVFLNWAPTNVITLINRFWYFYNFIIYFIICNLYILRSWRWPHGWPKHVRVVCIILINLRSLFLFQPSIYPYTNIHIYCRLYTQPQKHTACTTYNNVEQILLYHQTMTKYYFNIF